MLDFFGFLLKIIIKKKRVAFSAIPFGLRRGVFLTERSDLICPPLTVPFHTFTARFEPHECSRTEYIQSAALPVLIVQ
jgi:hypothetical protein